MSRTPTFAVTVVWCAAALAVVSAQSGDAVTTGPFQFEPLAASAACLVEEGTAIPGEATFTVPPGFVQVVVAREGDGGTTSNWDMNTLNESGPLAGRFLYRTHETDQDGQVSVTDLETGVTSVLAQRHDWNRMDGIVWTPWHTLLAAEEMRPGRLPSSPDPEVPQAQAGLVFEIDPETGASVARPALGAKAHEGIRLDPQGNVYGISETAPSTVVNGTPRPGGYIYKFVPDRRGDLSSGQLYALKVATAPADTTGEAVWVPLDREAVQIDADAAATAVGATGYRRPEDVEFATSTGSNRGGSNILYVAVTDEHRVLRIDLREPGAGDDTAFVSNYVVSGVNAPAGFRNPDNLALDKNGNLYIAEDVAIAAGERQTEGRDIWVAIPGTGDHLMAASTVRFASGNVCRGEPTGIYFDTSGRVLFVNMLHGPAEPRLDLTIAIMQEPHPE